MEQAKILKKYHDWFVWCEICYADYLTYRNGTYDLNDFNPKNIIFHPARGQFSLNIHIDKNKIEMLWLQCLRHKGKNITISEIMDLFKEKAASMSKRKMNDQKKLLENALTNLKHFEMMLSQYGYDFKDKKTSLDFVL